MKVFQYLFLFLLFLSFPILSLAKNPIDFTFKAHDGTTYQLSSFRGKVVLLNLFASYCPPCMIELKHLQKLNQECRAKGLQVISLMTDYEGAPLLSQIIKSRNLTYPVGLAPKEVFKIFSDFSITPTSYLIDQKGNLYKKVIGYHNYEEWKKLLKDLIGC